MKEIKTCDLHLACYLMANGVELVRIEQPESYKKRCTFVLVETTEKTIPDLLQWWSSPDSSTLKRVLYMNKVLKAELKRHFDSADV